MSAIIPDFSASRYRIDWAERKAQRVILKWAIFQRKNPCLFRTEYHTERECSVYAKPGYTSIDPRFAVELGEVLYNVRSALDNAVFVCSRQDCDKGRDFTKYEQVVAFPVCRCPDRFVDEVTAFPLKEKRRIIIEAVQPYNVRRCRFESDVRSHVRAIEILHDWARIDRHRRLHVVGDYFRVATHTIDAPDGSISVIYRPTGSGFMTGECEIGRFDIDTNYAPGEVKFKSELALEIGIDEAPARLGEPDSTVARLNTIIEAARAVIQALEESYR